MRYIIIVFFFGSLSCAYIKINRHLNLNIDKEVQVNKTGTFTETFVISSVSLVNSLDKAIEAKSATIENIQIEAASVRVRADAGNTATVLRDIVFYIKEGGTDKTLSTYNSNGLFINSGTIYALNSYLDISGVSVLKKEITKNLDRVNAGNTFTIFLSARISGNEVLKGQISLNFKISFDAVTCEKVPYGFGPSECMVVPIPLQVR